MLLKCCTWYASKFGQLSSGHRTGKGQFSFQSQRKAMPKNAQTTTQLHSSHMLASWKKSHNQPRQNIKKQRHYSANKGPSSQSYGFSSSHVWMWELDCKESWVLKKWCFQTMVLEKTLESPLDCRRSNQSILKAISPEYSLERLKLKLQYFGHLMRRTGSLEKILMLGKI